MSLGLSESSTALIWASAPLCGFIHPWIGLWSDRCTFAFGRRRSFLVFGAGTTVFCLTVLAYVREIFSSMTSDGVCTIATAVVVLLNICLTPLSFGLRATIVDLVSADQQGQANAFASYLISITNVLCLSLGSVDIPSVLGLQNFNQFQCLAIFVCLCITVTVSVSTVSARETGIQHVNPFLKTKPKVIGSGLRPIFCAYQKTPAEIRKVFAVQAFAWIAWFPFLFYMSRYSASSEEFTNYRTNRSQLRQCSVFVSPESCWKP